MRNVMISRGATVGTIEKHLDIEATTLTLSNREDELSGTMKINLSKEFFLTDKGDAMSYGTIINNCKAIAEDYGFNKFVLA